MNETTPSMVLSDRELELTYPDIPWRRALPVTSIEQPSVTGLGCRFCIARFGLKGCEIDRLPQTEEAWLAHMAEFHTPPEELN